MFTNINATEDLEQGFETWFFANLGFLESVFEEDKIFLVNEDTMDKIYPPRKKMGLNEGCLKEMLIPFKEGGFDYDKDSDKFIERLERCIEKVKGVVAVGLFVPKLSEDLAEDLGLSKTRELIFICPERVNSWASKVKSNFNRLSVSSVKKIVATKIIFHELAHKYMYNPSDGDRYNVIWKNLIEESLANAIAFKLLSNSLNSRAVVSRAILEQPFEYRQYHWWLDYRKSDFIGFFEWLLFCFEPFGKFDLAHIAKQWKFNDTFNINKNWWFKCRNILYYPPFYRFYKEFMKYLIEDLIEDMTSGKYFWKIISIQILKQAVL